MHYLILFVTVVALVWVLADKLWTRTRYLTLKPAAGPHALTPAQVQRLERLGIQALRVFGGGPAVAGRLLQHTHADLGESEDLFHAPASACPGSALIRRTETGYELRTAKLLQAQPPEALHAYVEAMLRTASHSVAAQRRCQRGQRATVAS